MPGSMAAPTYRPRPRGTLLQRLQAKIDTSAGPDQCWPWTGAKSRKRQGYTRGVIREGPAGGRVLVAARVMLCMIGNGLEDYDATFPDGSPRFAAHTCTNRLCCNPLHLYWATEEENIADRYRKDTEEE
jgi:hypothetical protein